MTGPCDDPWSLPNYTERIALATSILGHVEPADDRTRVAVRRAMLALQGATIDEIGKLEPAPMSNQRVTIGGMDAVEAGRMIREARLDANLTIAQLAQRIGLTRSAVSHYENGHREVSITRWWRAMEACGRTVQIVKADA